MKNNFCSNCGAKLKEGVKFCSKCGTKVGGTKTNKKTESKVGVIVAISVIAVLIFGFTTKAIYDFKKESNFKEDVTSFKSDMFKSFQDIESVGNELSTNLYVYMRTSKYKSPDDAISAALTSKASEVAKVNSEKPGLEKRYNELMEYDSKGNKKIEDIKDSLKNIYEEYNKVYEAAIKPVGTPTSIRGDYSEARSAFTIKYSELNTLLKE